MQQPAIELSVRPELFLHRRNDCSESLPDGRLIGNTALRHVSLPAPPAPSGLSNFFENAIRSYAALAQIIRHDAEKVLLSVYLRREYCDPAAETVANRVGDRAKCFGVGGRYAFSDDSYSIYV